MKFILKIGLIILILFQIGGCNEKYTPKPRGYFRIDFPEKKYHSLPPGFPYEFDIPDYARIVNDKFNPEEKNWINVSIPKNKADIHISYHDLDHQAEPSKVMLNKFMEETRKLAYKHTIKADAIQEQVFMNPSKDVYGLIYRINGNAASPLQFFLTDSTRHFLRGALYIRHVPNIDSIQPVLNFLEPDVIRLIETTTWN